jgi:CRP-like cAMP-binding protein
LSPSFFAVLQGQVHVTRKSEDKDIYIDTLGVGTVFGEAAMFLKTPRTADVSSAEASVLVKLTRFDLMDFLRAFPADGNKILLALVYGLLLKLKSANTELVFERRTDSNQSDIDALVAELTGS